MKISKKTRDWMVQQVKMMHNTDSLAVMRRAYKDAGLSETRFNWDVLLQCGAHPGYAGGITDDHIDTALRAVMRELTH